ncbi:hypothetical protein RWV98_02795 [Agathobaculum sp. NTUH-O15-33]|uniref:hypothetical protein n=1 Tax=Agathobaculum sp. NTUH-O15-33 TaxID=3079302 RepID=UPI00295892A7|nr:hypothetical protein [Agathobaculum sp. NTUH-O15-33]WNX85220.1 hypothetical protein RWV98_02795 [Agathobaculum sp. NTUH-O15-33]
MNPYHATAATLTVAIVMLAGQSDMGAPIWQTALGLTACGIIGAAAWVRYYRAKEDKRHHEQTERRHSA